MDSNNDPMNCVEFWARKGDLVKVKSFITKIKDPVVKVKSLGAALHEAAFANQLSVVLYLLSAGADPNTHDESMGINWTPLHRAMVQGNVEVVRALLEYHAKLEYPNERGQTPLHIACSAGQADVVKLMITEFNANWKAKDEQGRTPCDLAKEYGHESVQKFFKDFESSQSKSET